LLLKPQFVDDNIRAVQTIASRTVGIEVIVGYAARSEHARRSAVAQCGAVLRDGKIASTFQNTAADV